MSVPNNDGVLQPLRLAKGGTSREAGGVGRRVTARSKELLVGSLYAGVGTAGGPMPITLTASALSSSSPSATKLDTVSSIVLIH